MYLYWIIDTLSLKQGIENRESRIPRIEKSGNWRIRESMSPGIGDVLFTNSLVIPGLMCDSSVYCWDCIPGISRNLYIRSALAERFSSHAVYIR